MPKIKLAPIAEKIVTIYERKVPKTVREATKARINRDTLNLITAISDDMRDHIGELLRQGEEQGRSIASTASTLLKTGLDKGVFKSARRRAYLIARTELHRARQRAAVDIYKAAKIDMVKWVGIPSDGRICSDCLLMHGKHYKLSEIENNLPPLHPRCRCRVVPADFQLDISVKKNKAGKFVTTTIVPTPTNYKYVVKLGKIKKSGQAIEDLEKAYPHKYIRREGSKGNYQYFYPDVKGESGERKIPVLVGVDDYFQEKLGLGACGAIAELMVNYGYSMIPVEHKDFGIHFVNKKGDKLYDFTIYRDGVIPPKDLKGYRTNSDLYDIEEGRDEANTPAEADKMLSDFDYSAYEDRKILLKEFVSKEVIKGLKNQAINKLTENGYTVWTGMPRRKRPVWVGSKLKPEDEVKEKRFEDKVMRISDMIWETIEEKSRKMQKADVQVRGFGRRRRGRYELVRPFVRKVPVVEVEIIREVSLPKTGEEPFYSALEKLVNEKFPNAMPGNQLHNFLVNHGVKEEEIKWTKVDQLYNRHRITRNDIIDWVDKNRVVLSEEVKTGEKEPYGRSGIYLADTKYEKYVLAGGENYKELLFIWSIKHTNPFYREHWDEPNVLLHTRFQEFNDTEGNKVLMVEEVQSDWHQQGRKKGYETGTREEALAAKEEAVNAAVGEADKAEDLYLDKVIESLKKANALNKILRECYSVRKYPEYKGMSKEEKKIENLFKFDLKNRFSPQQFLDEIYLKPEEKDELIKLEHDYNRKLDNVRSIRDREMGVPDAPFKNTWYELGMRRMLQMAAEDGFDKLGWTTGEQQSERYDLTKYISSVDYEYNAKENFGRLVAFGKQDEPIIEQRIPPEKIIDYLGKEVADKMMPQIEEARAKEHPFKFIRLKEVDLKVGGEGMKGFYDKILVDYMNKLGKQYGVKVEDSVLDTLYGKELPYAEGVMPDYEKDRYKTVHSITIAPKMREDYVKGIPLFKADDEGMDLEKGGYDYSSTQVELPEPLVQKVLDLVKLVDKDDLHPTEKQEDIPHITVRYGLHTNLPDEVEEILVGTKTVKASILGIDVFNVKEKGYDVLVLKVDSPDLSLLNEVLAKLPNTSTWKYYQPHITICYLKQGKGEKYKNLVTGLEGQDLSFSFIMFSPKEGEKTKIDLEKARPHKYIKRLGTRGRYRYIYSDEEAESKINKLVDDFNFRKISCKQGLNSVEVLATLNYHLRKLTKRLVVDGRKKLSISVENIVSIDDKLPPPGAVYFRNLNLIEISKDYLQTFSHEYGHFLFDYDIGDIRENTEMPGIDDINNLDELKDKIQTVFEKWEEKYSPKNEQEEGVKELISKLKPFYVEKAKTGAFDTYREFVKKGAIRENFKDSCQYFFDVDEIFARAVNVYVEQGPSIEPFSDIENGEKYFKIVYNWGNRYLKTGIIKSLEKAWSHKYIRREGTPGKYAYFYVKPFKEKQKFLESKIGWLHLGKIIAKEIEPITGGRIEVKENKILSGVSINVIDSDKFSMLGIQIDDNRKVWLNQIYMKEEWKRKGELGPAAQVYKKLGELAKRYSSDGKLHVYSPGEYTAQKKFWERVENVEIGKSLEKARSYARWRHGRYEHVKGYPGKPRLFDLSPNDRIKRYLLDPSRPEIEVALKISSDIEAAGGKVLFIGGSVRDALIGKRSKDIDLEAYGLGPETLGTLLEKHGKVDKVGKSFGVFKVTAPGAETLDISIPRRESKTGKGHKGFMTEYDPKMSFKEAAGRRDLTINALAYNPIEDKIVDEYGGLRDIKDKKLRATNPETFKEDSLRVLRVMRFAGQLEFLPDLQLIKTCRRIDLSDLPKERVFGELEGMLLKSKRPSLGLRLAPILGIDKILPEMTNLRGVEQEPDWHPEGDAWQHTLMVVDAAAKMKKNIPDKEDKLIFMLAALCHDMGKPMTTEVREGKITTYGHDEEGGKVAVEFLNRLTNEKDVIEKVETLVRQHMKPTLFFKGKASDAAIRRLARRVDIPTLVMLSVADKTGRGLKKPNLEAERWLMQRYKKLGLEHPRALDPKVMGRHLIPLGFPPSKEMGRVLDKIYNAQLEGKFQTTEEGIEYAKQQGWISKDLEKARPHKYIRREGLPGDYKYFYTIPPETGVPTSSSEIRLPSGRAVVIGQRFRVGASTYTLDDLRESDDKHSEPTLILSKRGGDVVRVRFEQLDYWIDREEKFDKTLVDLKNTYNVNSILFGKESDRYKEIYRLQVDLSELSRKMVVDGKGILKIEVISLPKGKTTIKAIYFRQEKKIQLKRTYTNSLAHEYGHFVYYESLKAAESDVFGQIFPEFFIPVSLALPPELRVWREGDQLVGDLSVEASLARSELLGEAIRIGYSNLIESSLRSIMSPDSNEYKALKDLFTQMSNYYSNRMESASKDFCDYYSYILEPSEVFARAIHTYVYGTPDRVTQMEYTKEYEMIVKSWGDRWLKSGIIKSKAIFSMFEDLKKSVGVRLITTPNELRKSVKRLKKLDDKYVPCKVGKDILWAKSTKEGLILKKPVVKGDEILVKGEMAKVTAIGKVGVTARNEIGEKYCVLHEDVKIVLRKNV